MSPLLQLSAEPLHEVLSRLSDYRGMMCAARLTCTYMCDGGSRYHLDRIRIAKTFEAMQKAQEILDYPLSQHIHTLLYDASVYLTDRKIVEHALCESDRA